MCLPDMHVNTKVPPSSGGKGKIIGTLFGNTPSECDREDLCKNTILTACYKIHRIYTLVRKYCVHPCSHLCCCLSVGPNAGRPWVSLAKRDGKAGSGMTYSRRREGQRAQADGAGTQMGKNLEVCLQFGPRPTHGTQERAWRYLAGFLVCAESAHYVSNYIPYWMHSNSCAQVAVGYAYVKSPCLAMTRGKSWKPTATVYLAATLFYALKKFHQSLFYILCTLGTRLLRNRHQRTW